MRSTRAQSDRLLYKQNIQKHINANRGITIFQQVVDLIVQREKVCGVKVKGNMSIFSSTVILTAGTFGW